MRCGPARNVLIVVCAAEVLAGCRLVRGGTRKDQPSIEQPAGRKATGDAWIDGRLPDSVLQGQPQAGGEVTVQIDADPPSLNGNIDSDYWGSQIASNHVYESLVTNDRYDEPRFGIKAALAQSWEVSEDGRTYTF